MKTFFKVISVIFVVAVLVGCSMGGETATIVLSVGRAGDARAVSLSELSHVIVFSGPTGSKTVNLPSGGGSVTVSVAPGTWTISVTAYYQGEVYATGSATAEVRAGKSTSVSVQMTVVYMEAPDFPAAPVDNRPVLLGVASIGGDNWIGGICSAHYTTDVVPLITEPIPAEEDNRFIIQWFLDGILVHTESAHTFGGPLGDDSYFPPTGYFENPTHWNKDIYAVISHPDFKGSLKTKTLRICRAIQSPTDWIDFASQASGWGWQGNSYILLSNGIPPAVTLFVGDDGGGNITPFNGYFDGNGETMDINSFSGTGTGDKGGIFAHIAPNGIVKNLKLTGGTSFGTTSSDCYFGGVAGLNEGTIMNVLYDGIASLSGSAATSPVSVYTGGIVGYNKGTIKNCYVNILEITATGGVNTYAGGIAGVNDGQISYCWVKVDTANGISAITNGVGGGMVGQNNNTGIINNCVVMDGSINGTTEAGRIWGGAIVTPGSGGNNFSYDSVTVNLFPIISTNASDKNGADAAGTDLTSENWWTGTSGPNWSSVWGGDSPSEDKPWWFDDYSNYRPELSFYW